MQVKCIDNSGCFDLTVGKKYIVLGEEYEDGEEYYHVISDTTEVVPYFKRRFVPALEEQKLACPSCGCMLESEINGQGDVVLIKTPVKLKGWTSVGEKPVVDIGVGGCWM